MGSQRAKHKWTTNTFTFFPLWVPHYHYFLCWPCSMWCFCSQTTLQLDWPFCSSDMASLLGSAFCLELTLFPWIYIELAPSHLWTELKNSSRRLLWPSLSSVTLYHIPMFAFMSLDGLITTWSIHILTYLFLFSVSYNLNISSLNVRILSSYFKLNIHILQRQECNKFYLK